MKTKSIRWGRWAAPLVATLPAIGCVGGDAHLEIAAANLLDATSDALVQTLNEYHQETLAADALLKQRAVLAFANRITTNSGDPEHAAPNQDAINQHTTDFATALARLNADAQAEWKRHIISMSNLKIVRETAASLRSLAIESLSLEDETKRYLTDALVQLKEYRARDPARTTPPLKRQR